MAHIKLAGRLVRSAFGFCCRVCVAYNLIASREREKDLKKQEGVEKREEQGAEASIPYIFDNLQQLIAT